MRKCSECEYWDISLEETKYDKSDWLRECKRYPPFEQKRGFDWCGEFQKRTPDSAAKES